MFDADETKTSTDVTLDEQTGTFTFSIVAQLKTAAEAVVWTGSSAIYTF